MTYKSLDSETAKAMVQQGTTLQHYAIKALDISDMTFKHDVTIIECVIEQFSARNSLFEGRADFSGTHFGRAAEHQPSHLDSKSLKNSPEPECSFNKVIFSGEVIFDECLFFGPVDFSHARFKQGARFQNARFNDESNFLESTFEKISTFENARFNNETNFSSFDFGEEIIFRNSEFGGLTDFTGAKFGSAEFQDCKFNDTTLFHHTRFESWADFSRTMFAKDLDLADSFFNNGADFSEVKFNEVARFEKTFFKEDVYFVEANFCQLADFDTVIFFKSTDFRRCVFQDRVEFRHVNCKEASFIDTHFLKPAYFSGLHAGKINLQNTPFKDEVRGDNNGTTLIKINFQQAHFHDDANFGQSTIDGAAIFDGALFDNKVMFDQATLNQVSFNQAQFHDSCSFRSIAVAAHFCFEKTLVAGEADFHGANFEGQADFSNAKFSARVHFRNVCFNNDLNFKAVNFSGRTDFTGASFNGTICCEDIIAENIILDWSQVDGKLASHQNNLYPCAMKEYGILKTLFEKQNKYEDMDRAYCMFKRMERKSKPLNFKHPIKLIAGLIKKLTNLLILDLGSGYGTRPLNIALTTIVLIVLFGCFYFMFSDQIIVGDRDLYTVKNLGFCLYYSFVSFITFGAENLYPNYSGWLKYVVAIQAFTGFFMMTLFVATFTRKVIR